MASPVLLLVLQEKKEEDSISKDVADVQHNAPPVSPDVSVLEKKNSLKRRHLSLKDFALKYIGLKVLLEENHNNHSTKVFVETFVKYSNVKN